MAERLACPSCGSEDLATLEVATCVSLCDEITTDGPEFSGETDFERGSQKTVGVICNACNWQHEDPNWLSALKPAREVVRGQLDRLLGS